MVSINRVALDIHILFFFPIEVFLLNAAIAQSIQALISLEFPLA